MRSIKKEEDFWMASIGFATYEAVKALIEDLELRLTLRLDRLMIAVGGLAAAFIKLLPYTVTVDS